MKKHYLFLILSFIFLVSGIIYNENMILIITGIILYNMSLFSSIYQIKKNRND